MEKSLRILHLEDEPDFCELVKALLERDAPACDMLLVDGKEAFEAALARNVYDVILCDHTPRGSV